MIDLGTEHIASLLYGVYRGAKLPQPTWDELSDKDKSIWVAIAETAKLLLLSRKL